MIRRVSVSLLSSMLFICRSSAAEEPKSALELTSLKALHDKGVIDDDEYENALRDPSVSTGSKAEQANTITVGGWATTLYGFVEADMIYDSTQSFNEQAGNLQVERPAPFPLDPPAPQTTYRGDHDRLTFSVRNSRVGLSTRSPKTHGASVTGVLEFDLLGSQPTVGYATPQLSAQNQGPAAGQTTEFATFATPAMRLRHGYFKVETPIVDVLAGQYWQVFGWGGTFRPNTVEIQGVPGQLYSRAPQLRVSRTFHAGPVTIDAAVAAGRPPQRDSARPDLQGGVKAAFNGWAGMHTGGATSTSLVPLTLGVSGVSRQFTVPEFSALPSETVNKTMAALALNAIIPVLPAREDKKGNALTLTGEFVNGAGIADFYSGLTGGMLMPAVANTTNLNPPPTYPQNVDNGLVVFDLNGDLHGIKWTTFVIGAEYYLPFFDGKVWVSANYSHSVSANAKLYTRPATQSLPNPQEAFYVSAAQVRDHMDWYDFNLFADVVGPVRVGAEYAVFVDSYVDGVKAVNQRAQLSTYFLF